MNIQTTQHKICPQTSQPEMYVCTNKNCIKQNQQQLHCYQCLTKLHRNKKQQINHLDDFIQIKQVLQQNENKYEQRSIQLQTFIRDANDFHKGKIQQIEKYPFQSQEMINKTLGDLETETYNFTIKLEQLFNELNQARNYSKETHKIIIDLYFQNDHQLTKQLTKERENMEEKINQILAERGLDIQESYLNQKRKFNNLEQQIQKLQNPFSFNKISKFVLIIVALVMISNQFSIMTNRQFQKLDEKVLFEITNEIIKEQITEVKEDQIIIIEEIKNMINYEFIQEIEYVKLNNQKLKIELIEMQKYIKDYQNQTVQTIQNLQIQVKELNNSIQIQNETIHQLQILGQLQLQQNNIQNNQNILSENTQFNEAQIIKLDQMLNESSNIIKEEVQLKLQINRFFTFAMYYLLGKIETDYPIVLLQGFRKYYDEPLTVKITQRTLYDLSQSFSITGIACLGGINMDKPSHFVVMACDFAYEIFTPTQDREKARKSRSSDNLYWYFVQGISFGFSPTEKIRLTLTDDHDPQDDKRFSQWIDNRFGGRRIGNETQIMNTTQYRVVLYQIE